MPDTSGLWPPFHEALDAMLADPEARALRLYVVSAFRSTALQATLYADAVRRYGKAEAGKWVAPPGRSNHGPRVDAAGHEPGPYGRAVDLGVPGYAAVSGHWPTAIKRRVDALAARYGLRSPMSWEDWHYEPIPGRLTPKTPTTPPKEPTVHLNTPVTMKPVVAFLPTRSGKGAWLASADGDVYTFGDAPYRPQWDTVKRTAFAGHTVQDLDYPRPAEDRDGHAFVVVDTAGNRYAP